MNKNKYMRAIDHLVTNICSEDEIVSLLKCIEDYFGYDWLKEKGIGERWTCCQYERPTDCHEQGNRH